jgi:hypothetical protein
MASTPWRATVARNDRHKLLTLDSCILMPSLSR